MSRPRPSLLPALLALGIAVSMLLAPGVSTSQAASAAPSLRQNAERYLNGVSLAAFVKAKRANEPRDASNPLDWSDDGCSIPEEAPQDKNLGAFFAKSCWRHDFGYRNFGNGVFEEPRLAFDSVESRKKAIDSRFKADMLGQCERAYDGRRESDCRAAAVIVHGFVNASGRSWTGFYDKECTPGYFCLFDDTGFKDRRKRFTVSHDDMNDFDFGDKASAAKNATGDAWVIYDDSGYDDRSYCIPAGGKVSSLGARWDFNDKTSSIKRLSTRGCP